ncbi:MAG TPA: hypothetical protein DIU07_10025 [Rhodobacteraceae bacterium]|nr:hypothetical protein [Paracoccaceae bacterium]
MTTTLQDLARRAREIEAELEAEIATRRDALGGRLVRGRIVFEAEVLARHRAARENFLDYVRAIRLRDVATAPVIYSLIVPIALVDFWVTLYQWICFPAYGIPRVRRRDFVVIDRHHLGYLNALDKFNCAYCGYCNGVIGYVREVASRTEAYWCPIKHARRWPGGPPRYAEFMDYGDEADHLDRWEQARARVRGTGGA